MVVYVKKELSKLVQEKPHQQLLKTTQLSVAQ